MTTAAAQAFQRAVLSKPIPLERSLEDTQPLQVQRKGLDSDRGWGVGDGAGQSCSFLALRRREPLPL